VALHLSHKRVDGQTRKANALGLLIIMICVSLISLPWLRAGRAQHILPKDDVAEVTLSVFCEPCTLR